MSDLSFIDSPFFGLREKLEMARGDINFKAKRIAELEAQLATAQEALALANADRATAWAECRALRASTGSAPTEGD